MPVGTQSNSSADGCGDSDGIRSATARAVWLARSSGECQTASNGTPDSRSARNAACRRPRGESGPSIEAVLGILMLAVPHEVDVVRHASSLRRGFACLESTVLQPMSRRAATRATAVGRDYSAARAMSARWRG